MRADGKRGPVLQPTRRDVLAGGLALAGASLVGGAATGAAGPAGSPRRLVLTLRGGGPIGAGAMLERAAPFLAREGFDTDAVDLLVAEAYRPPGFQGHLLTPAALMALPADRLAALLAQPGKAQIAASWPLTSSSPAQTLERLAALLRLVPDVTCCVIALRGTGPLSEADRTRFEAALAPFARTLGA